MEKKAMEKANEILMQLEERYDPDLAKERKNRKNGIHPMDKNRQANETNPKQKQPTTSKVMEALVNMGLENGKVVDSRVSEATLDGEQKPKFSTSLEHAYRFKGIQRDVYRILLELRESLDKMGTNSFATENGYDFDELCVVLKALVTNLEEYVKSFVIDGQPIFSQNGEVDVNLRVLTSYVPGIKNLIKGASSYTEIGNDFTPEFAKKILLNDINHFEKQFKTLESIIDSRIKQLEGVWNGKTENDNDPEMQN